VILAEAGDWFSLPLVDTTQGKAAVIALGYLVTLLASGRIIRAFVPPPTPGGPAPAPSRRWHPSVVIGKAENILTVTMILASVETGLALLISAKALVRKEKIEEDPGFYLGGMLVNLTFGVLMGFLTRLAAFGF
jgi:hypothetical protein